MDNGSKRAVGVRQQQRRRKSFVRQQVKEVGLDLLRHQLQTRVVNSCDSSNQILSDLSSSDSISSDDIVMCDYNVDDSIIIEKPPAADEDISCKYISDSDSDSDVVLDPLPDLVGFLRNWSIENNITHSSLNKLLKGLKRWHKELPSDARTLLRTPRDIATKKMGGGEYFYFGLEAGLTKDLELFSFLGGKVNLRFNIDGLPLYKSTNKQFWPVLCLVDENPQTKPFVVALFSGSSKPPVDEFLSEFAKELKNLESNGFLFNGQLTSIESISFCCDSPAKAFVKCTKMYSGYYGCDNCSQKGLYIGRMTYPEIDAPVRTDAEFDEMANVEHHKGTSPLSILHMGLVTGFPLDYLHLVCLGVTRRLLTAWKDRSSPQRLRLQNLKDVSANLLASQSFWPSEFNRKPRSLDEVDRWKATEFRQFLLYLGPVYLKGVLSDVLYDHFLLFFCAITILISEKLNSDFNSIAEDLLRRFVTEAADLYGKEILIYNMHSLVHLSSHARRFGPLDKFGAFPFENFLCSLKRMLRKTTNPLQQVCRRLKERELHGCSSTRAEKRIGFEVVESSKLRSKDGPSGGVNGEHFTKVVGPKFKLGAIDRDSCMYLSNGVLIKACNFVRTDTNEIFVVGQRFSNHSDFFSFPSKSSEFSIFRVKGLLEDYTAYPISRVSKKAVLLPYKSGYVCFPMQHTDVTRL
jgi:hypothetical protein